MVYELKKRTPVKVHDLNFNVNTSTTRTYMVKWIWISNKHFFEAIAETSEQRSLALLSMVRKSLIMIFKS